MSYFKNTLNKKLSILDLIKELIKLKPHNWFTILNKNSEFSYIKSYIETNTPLLADKFYKITTKVYWLLNAIKSFEDERCKCHTCGKLFKDRNVSLNGYPRFCAGKNGNNCSQINLLVQLKSKTTCILKYGVSSYTKTQECKDKTKASFMKHYGTTNNMKTHLGIEEYKKSMQEKYNVNFCALNPTICEKQLITKLLKYGHRGIGNIDKAKQTLLSKYGVINSMQIHSVRLKAHYRYLFDLKFFDSSPELAYYIWLKDNNINFEYLPNKVFKYLDENGIEHKYFPDFYLKDINLFIEIKGALFFDKEGNPINSYNKESWKAKYDCIISNNIKLMLEDEYKLYIKYCITKFKNKYWYRLFKKSKKI